MRRGGALVLGIAAAALACEVGLRLLGWTVTHVQERANRMPVPAEALTVLCLGDSMTQGQYTRYLQEALSAACPGKAWKVIDEGRSSTDSDYIVTHLSSFCDRYRPQVLIVMTGENDRSGALPYDLRDPRARIRAYKLLRLLRYDIRRVADRSGMSAGRVAAPGPGAVRASVRDAGDELLEQGRFADARAWFVRASAREPRDPRPYRGLAQVDLGQGRYRSALAVLERAQARAVPQGQQDYELMVMALLRLYSGSALDGRLRKIPRTFAAQAGLVSALLREGDLARARRYLFALDALSGTDIGHGVTVGRMHWRLGDYDAAERAFSAAAGRARGADLDQVMSAQAGLREFREQLAAAHAAFERERARDLPAAGCALAQFYARYDMCAQVERLVQQALRARPDYVPAHRLLGYLREGQGRYVDAERAFSVVISSWASYEGYSRLSRMRLLQGDPAAAERFRDRWGAVLGRLRVEGCTDERVPGTVIDPRTEQNYAALVAEARRRGIALVCMQYPLRPLRPLRDLVAGFGYHRVSFVENEQAFSPARVPGRYFDYFVDYYAGDFGHCTEQGNRLIARSAARAVIAAVRPVTREEL